ncbi:hypothetical protein IA54_018900 [Xanthomonas phaseoli pv. syngonii LMG 9055]|uniref:Uncharacterized protein n=1 Tax=Xanthomonas phaseoli pv. syngonii LMG 9055 TaxID=1437878 RepID=A0A1V9HM13_9XANT|nr:hypothetical protein IA54_018900 [Xanthomonas phaseoli pv. syngonii LMG 9055]
MCTAGSESFVRVISAIAGNGRVRLAVFVNRA